MATLRAHLPFLFFAATSILAFLLLGAGGLEQQNSLLLSLKSQAKVRGQVYYPTTTGYTETRSYPFSVAAPDRTVRVRIPLPSKLPTKLRIDPADQPADVLIEYAELATRYSVTRLSPDEIASRARPLMFISLLDPTAKGLLVRSTGNDPAFELILPPAPPNAGRVVAVLMSGAAAVLIGAWLTLVAIAGRSRTAPAKGPISRTLAKWAGSVDRRYWPWVNGFALAAIFLIYAFPFEQPSPFCCDAEHYWKISESFEHDGTFSLTAFASALRGYSFPLLLHVMRSASRLLGLSQFALPQIANCLFWAGFAAWTAPSLLRHLTGASPHPLAGALFGLLVFAFWRGFLVDPMTDMLCVLFVLTVLDLCLRQAGREHWSPAAGAVAGVLLGLALNMRPVYLLAPLFVGGALYCQRAAAGGRRFAFVATLVTGMVLPLLPQSLINAARFESYSPLVQTRLALPDRSNLYVFQIYVGAALQRHECAVFLEPAGIEILKRSGVDNLRREGDTVWLDLRWNGSPRHYLGMVASHPLDFVGIYARHIVNGIAVFGSNIYRCAIRPPDKRYLFGSFAAWLLGLLGIIVFRRTLLEHWRGVLFLTAPVATALVAIPTAMEARYFLPLHVLAYLFAALAVTSSATLRFVGRNVPVLAVSCVLLFSVYTMQLGSMLASAHAPLRPLGTANPWPMKPDPLLLW